MYYISTKFGDDPIKFTQKLRVSLTEVGGGQALVGVITDMVDNSLEYRLQELAIVVNRQAEQIRQQEA